MKYFVETELNLGAHILGMNQPRPQDHAIWAIQGEAISCLPYIAQMVPGTRLGISVCFITNNNLLMKRDEMLLYFLLYQLYYPQKHPTTGCFIQEEDSEATASTSSKSSTHYINDTNRNRKAPLLEASNLFYRLARQQIFCCWMMTTINCFSAINHSLSFYWKWCLPYVKIINNYFIHSSHWA